MVISFDSPLTTFEIGDTMFATQAALWEPFHASYLATMSGPIEISIVNVSGRTFPNDFMLDDIALVPIPEPTSGLLSLFAALTIGLWRWRPVAAELGR